MITCGCDCHELDPDDNNVVIWQSRTWNPTCALKASIKVLGNTTEELESLQERVADLARFEELYKNLLATVEWVKCVACLRPVGKDWLICCGNICCNGCTDDFLTND